MRSLYERPEAYTVIFRAAERLATEPDPEVDGGEIDLGGEVTASGNVDWEWPEN